MKTGGDALDLERLLLDPTDDLLARTTRADRTENDGNGSHSFSFRKFVETSSTLQPASLQDNPGHYQIGHRFHKVLKGLACD